MAILVNERDKLLSTTVPRLVDPAESDPLVVTASSPLLKYVANPASPSELLPSGSITLYALTSRIGDVSWSIVGGPITGVTLSASVGGTVNLTFTNALANDSVGVLASINNTNYYPASVQITLNFTKQLPAKSIKNLTIYKRGTVTPSTPTGGNYVFSSNTLVPPSGWSFSIPSGTDPVYSSTTQVFTYKDDSAVAINTSGWAAPVLTVQNGTNGAPGAPGQRGSVDLYVIGSSWSDTVANNAIYNATGSYVKYAGDKVTIYNNTDFAQTKYWDGISSWVTGQIIDGNLLVSGTVTSDKIGTNTISAANINVTKSGWNPGTGSTTVRYNNVDYTVFSPSIFNNTNTNNGLAHAGMSGKVTGQGSYMFGVSGVAANSGTGNTAVGIHGNAYGSGSTYGGVFNGGTADIVLSGSGKIQWGPATAPILPPDGSTTKYLRADGTWATISGSSSGVTSFNSRTGAVTLNSTDVANAVAGTGVTLQANITGNAGNASTLGGYDTTYYMRGTGVMVTGSKTLTGYLPVIGGGTNAFIAVYL